MYTTGSSEFGQLGNGETGEYFVTASKLAFANEKSFVRRTTFCHAPQEKLHTSAGEKPSIVPLSEDIRIGSVACGKHHAIAIEAPCQDKKETPRVFTWGCGNYGCLGHGVQADEYRPRVVGVLRSQKGVRLVRATAGASCSMVLTENGHIYYWGKHRTIGESVMRPQLLVELAHNGHIVTKMGAGAQTVVCSTQHAVTVGWGQGPHGELGLETKKSSAKPQFVPKLDKCRVLDLSCGYGTTYWVVQNDDDDDKKAVKQLPTLSDEAVEQLEQLSENVETNKRG
uniref:Uncharacterized protein n=1 Tax=Cyclophora tenuis TaxID=216820 RepID=A0A7S1GNS8_CYCTE|mmetsp:Transcript_437/g.769  ORF Transcript_437/g.769 Transcript_437/m.769 type:complete len:283 (+) Transcript_437:286-1134(+)